VATKLSPYHFVADQKKVQNLRQKLPTTIPKNGQIRPPQFYSQKIYTNGGHKIAKKKKTCLFRLNSDRDDFADLKNSFVVDDVIVVT
jgi:hypothetical protein